MAFTPMPGGRVQTARFGTGTVVRPTRTGAVVALDRLGRLEVDVPLDQLTPMDSGNGDGRSAPDSTPALKSSPRSPAAAVAPRAAQTTPLNEEQLRTRRSLEALRFGIVPRESIADLTLGYQELEQWVLQQLPGPTRKRPGVCEIYGPFGTGKSHTMAAIRHVAADRGFVTARVEVDGNGVSLSDPASVLQQLWRTIAAKDLESPTPLVDINLRAIERGRAQADTALADYERVHSNLLTVGTLKRTQCIDRHGEVMETILACGDDVTAVEARQDMWRDASASANWGGYGDCIIAPKRLIGRRTDERPQDFVDCLVGYSVLARLAGFQGLVVTIDEFEVEAASLTGQKIERLVGVINALASALGGNRPKKSGPLAVFVATVGQEGHLGDEIVDALVSNTGGARYELKPWPRTAHRQLAERIFGAYRRAYGLDASFDSGVANAVQDGLDDTDVEGSGLIRAFIKRYVAELDSKFGPVAA